MKRQNILLIGIILIGGMVIILPSFFSSYLDRKEDKKIKVQEQNHNTTMRNIESTLETLDEPEILDEQMESEPYDENQMFFEGIEGLYHYFLFGEVEDIKEKVQNYVHQNISNNLLDCKLVTDSIEQNNDIIKFNLEMENIKSFVVEIVKQESTNTLDITIIHGINK